jgi:diaminopropionate ammonia-lyase
MIMLGYTRMLDEAFAELKAEPTAVFVQGGVGGLLCAVASWFAFHHPATRVVSVEPTTAACLQASARAGRPVTVEGPLDTAMAGLRNREVSPLAFAALLPCVDAFLAIDDRWAVDAMRAFAHPLEGDVRIHAGASGSAALGGLLAICRDPSMKAVRDDLGLDRSAQVLVVVSEGVTDPDHWRATVA